MTFAFLHNNVFRRVLYIYSLNLCLKTFLRNIVIMNYNWKSKFVLGYFRQLQSYKLGVIYPQTSIYVRLLLNESLSF